MDDPFVNQPDKRKGHLNAAEWEEMFPLASSETFRERAERARNLAKLAHEELLGDG